VEINQRAMVAADRGAREAALRSAGWLGVLVGIALLSLVGLSRSLQRHFLSRLSRLERAMAAIAEGEESRRVREEGSDELSLIARQFNRLLDRRQELSAASDGRVARERRVVLGLLEALGEGAALYALSGALMASASESPRFESEVADWIASEGRKLVERWGSTASGAPPTGRVDLSSGGYAAVRLLAGGRRRAGVGWLVTPQPAGER
jgi:HAMP domain-containing protein